MADVTMREPTPSKKPAELYDLGNDAGETRNLAGERPEIVAKLVAAIATWEKGTVAPVFEPPLYQRKKMAKERKVEEP